MPFQPNENLSGALRASLRLVEKEAQAKDAVKDASPSHEQPPIVNSPLAEVEADSIEEELDRINQGFIAGVPEKITDEKLASLVDLYRAQALRWEQEESVKKPRSGRSPKPVLHIEALEF